MLYAPYKGFAFLRVRAKTIREGHFLWNASQVLNSDSYLCAAGLYKMLIHLELNEAYKNQGKQDIYYRQQMCH